MTSPNCRYKAVKQPDENYSIPEIEIFTECSRFNEATGKTDVFDGEFIQKACARFNERAAEGYLPPVHLDHHAKEGESSAKFAGHIGALRAKQNAKGQWQAIATLVDIPSEVMMNEIVAKRRPFRSVEINDPENAEFSSLALLSTVVPFHKFPLTRVTLEDGAPVSSVFKGDNAAVCFAEDRARGRVACVQHFAEPGYFAKGKKSSAGAEGDDRDESDYDGDYIPNEQDSDTGLGPVEDGEADDISLMPNDYADDYDGGMQDDFGDDDLQELQSEGEGNDMGAIASALSQLASGQSQLAQAVTGMGKQLEQLAGAPSGANPGTPPPVVAQESAKAAVHFKADSALPIEQRYIALERAHNELVDKHTQLFNDTRSMSKKFAELTESHNRVVFAQNADAVVSAVESVCEAEKAKMLEAGYGEDQAADAEDFVNLKVKDAVIVAAQNGARREDIERIVAEVPALFAERTKRSIGPTGTGVRPPTGSKVPAPNVNANAVGANAVKFAESDPDIAAAVKRIGKPLDAEMAKVAQTAAVQFDAEKMSAKGFTKINFIAGELKRAVAFKEAS